MINLQNDFKAAVSYAVPFDGSPTYMTQGYGGPQVGLNNEPAQPGLAAKFDGPTGMGG